MPRLSVLLPVKNGEETIARAIRSTLRALPHDSELVIFDDASTDSTLQALHSIDDRRVKVLSSADVTGVTGALNYLLQHTDSELVGRMDADDVALPWRFSLQQRAVNASCRVNFTTVVEWYPAARRISPNWPRGISTRAFPYHLLLTNPVAHPTMLAERSALELVNGYRDVPAEDYDLWLRLQLAGVRMRCSFLPALVYRMHGAQVTASPEWRHASWASEEISSAFQQVSRELLGHPYLRLTTLTTSPELSRAEFNQTLDRFESDVTRASAQLHVVERAFLLRKLRSRLRWANSRFTESAD